MLQSLGELKNNSCQPAERALARATKYLVTNKVEASADAA
jgi:hypothetical protein